MNQKIVASFLIFSTVLGSGLFPHPAVESYLQVIGGGLFLRRLSRFNQKIWILPSLPVSLAWGLLALFCALSLSWTAHFHATLTALHKIILITLLGILFLNERELWEKAIRLSVIWIGALCAFLLIFFRLETIALRPSPNLTGGFMAISAILSMRRLPFFMFTSLAVILSSSLGSVLAWGVGIILETRRKISRLTLIFSALLILVSLLPVAHNKLFHLWERKISDPFVTERISIWKDSVKMFLAHPIRGVGWGSFSDVYPQFKSIPGLRNAPYAHNELLNALCETGMIGGVLGLFLIGCVLNPGLKNRPSSTVWTSMALSILIQSLFDFNLHYAPITILFTFCMSTLIPTRDPIVLKPAFRNSLAILTVLWMVLAALPGAASLIFVLDPGKNAVKASVLDPFNGLYRSRTGKMRDLEIAIALNPRNVWYRRQAALFYISDWQNSKIPASLESAKSEYQKILKLAPNVPEFREEYKKIFN